MCWRGPGVWGLACSVGRSGANGARCTPIVPSCIFLEDNPGLLIDSESCHTASNVCIQVSLSKSCLNKLLTCTGGGGGASGAGVKPHAPNLTEYSASRTFSLLTPGIV